MTDEPAERDLFQRHAAAKARRNAGVLRAVGALTLRGPDDTGPDADGEREQPGEPDA